MTQVRTWKDRFPRSAFKLHPETIVKSRRWNDPRDERGKRLPIHHYSQIYVVDIIDINYA